MKKLVCTTLASLLLAGSLTSCNLKNDNHIETDSSETIKANDTINNEQSTKIDYQAVYADTVNSYAKIITDFMRDPKAYSSVTCPPCMDEELESDLLSLYHNYGSALTVTASKTSTVTELMS